MERLYSEIEPCTAMFRTTWTHTPASAIRRHLAISSYSTDSTTKLEQSAMCP